MITVRCTTTEHLALAYHQNSIPFVSELVIENTSEIDVVDVVVSLASEPAVVQPTDIRLERIGAGQLQRIENPDIGLDAAALSGFTEASVLQLTATVAAPGGVRAECLARLRRPSPHPRRRRRPGRAAGGCGSWSRVS